MISCRADLFKQLRNSYQIGDRVKYTDSYLDKLDEMGHPKAEWSKTRGTVVSLLGPMPNFIKVRWDGDKMDDPIETVRIEKASYKKADLFKQVNKIKHHEQWQAAHRELLQKAKGHTGVYEFEFDGVETDGEGIPWSGTLQMIYDAKFIPGSRASREDPGEPDSYEISVDEIYILPGEVTNDNTGEEIYDPEMLQSLAQSIGEAVGGVEGEAAFNAIDEYLTKRDADL